MYLAVPPVQRVFGDVRILIVEDEVRLAAHVARALEHDGHNPRLVHDGKVGLIEARDGSYDLVVLDVELPGMDGIPAKWK